MKGALHNLRNIQAWIQAVITNPAGIRAGISSEQAQAALDVDERQVSQVVTRSRDRTETERLAVYGNAYFSRLIECLRELFPALLYTLSEEVFDQFAIGYLEQYPSRSYTLHHLPDRFVTFLEASRDQWDECDDDDTESDEDDGGETSAEPGGESDSDVGAEVRAVRSQSSKANTNDVVYRRPEEKSLAEREPNPTQADWPDFLIDLARLETTIDQVFDGPGVENEKLLDEESLARIAPDAWPAARLAPAVCLRLLAFRFPINDYYTAFRQGKEPDLPAHEESFLAVTRRDYTVWRFPLSRPQYDLLSALVAGRTVGEAIAQAAEHSEDLDGLSASLKNWFALWTANGFFQGIE